MSGSQQLRRFRIAMRAGSSIERAAGIAGLGLIEARMHALDDAKNPPPPEAYEPLGAGFCATCAASLCGCSDAAWMGAAA